jgi:SSS family solute:Na+ symporter/sodium/proline symporter
VAVYLYVILGYLLVLTGFNIYRSRQIKSQDDFMVAGRSLSITKMVFTLVCTWIGSGTFIAGAEFASYAGWSAVWQPAGAFLGIAIIYFVAAKIRTFGQYTIGDILEVRYGKFARLFGAIALIIAFTTIVSYQFRAGGEILSVVTDGAVSPETGQTIAAIFVILFVTIGGMVAVAHTDLPNGIIIVSACLLAVPFVIAAAGGWAHPHAVLKPGYFQVFSPDFGKYPALKALGYFLSTFLLLLGVQSMYQKFYSARTPAEAKKAVAIWIVGTIVVETIVICIAVFAYSYNVEHGMNWSGRSLVLNAARHMVPGPVGVLLLGAACAVVLSTGMNYLLSCSSNIVRDIYQKMVNPAANPDKMIVLQKTFIVVMGFCAFLMIFIPTYYYKGQVSVLQYAFFAYTIYGVAVTPALLAALTWKRATRQGGLASIVGGAVAAVFFEVLMPRLAPSVMVGTDAWGIPSIYPAAVISIGLLVFVSLMTPPPTAKELEKLFPGAAARAPKAAT